jgi:hypothetical protein
MPFSPQVKARIFVRSARICCLCFKPCGTRIEAAHIVAEADGGSNDDDNAIPLCFDCHEEIGSYNPRHPKGNKFTNVELKTRRDALYRLVDQGVIQAQIFVHRFGLAGGLTPSTQDVRDAVGEAAYEPSREARAVLDAAVTSFKGAEGLPRKLRLLSERDRGFVLDALLQEFSGGMGADALLGYIVRSEDRNQALLLLEQILRQVTLRGDVAAKSRILRLTPPELLSQADESLRSVFFEDVISIMESDQYEEVNVLTPAVVNAHAAVPSSCTVAYARALLGQASSGAWHGAPAAKRALQDLPPHLLDACFEFLDAAALSGLGSARSEARAVISHYRSQWPANRAELYNDFLSLELMQFLAKHYHDGI